MGWLGWTYDQTVDTPMPAIETAYEGRIDMIQQVLKAVFGDGKEDKVSKTPMSPGLFDSLFGGKE